MSRGGGRNSVVLTKYGERPLIDIPPLSLSSRADDDDVPNHLFRVPGKRSSHVFHQPPRSPQVSLTAPQPQRRYQEPLMEQPNYHQHSHQGQNRSYYQPQYQNQPPPPPPPQAHFQPQVQQNHYSNLAPDSNLVPYNYTHYRPQPQMPQPVPQYNTTSTHAPAPIPDQVPNGTQPNEVHVYYGPNGERLPGPLPRPRYPTDFTLEGTLEYGKLVSVKVRNSNISYREIPDFVFQDLYKTYRMMERTDVKIVAQGGEYNIYASPNASNDTVANNPGYVYEQPVRQVPVAGNQREIYDPRRRQSYDPFTKIYRYERDSLRERYPPVSKRGRSHLDDIDEDYDDESQLMTRDTLR